MTEHRPLTLLVGPGECHERECGEYDTPDGYDDPGVERCSHITEEIVCAACSTEHDTNGLYGGTVYDPTIPWPCAHAAARPVEEAR
ncbi:hypothetical protein AB0N23_13360 [Streptomyces sp. NPDC052644]